MDINPRKVDLNYDTNPSFHHQFNADILRLYLHKNDLVLDVGCWTGQLIALLKRDYRMLGIDIVDGPLRIAKNLHPKAEFYKASVFKIPFPKAHFSAVIFNDVIEHLPPRSEKKALGEIRRVTRPGGKLLITTMFDHPLSKIMDPAWFLGHRHYSEEDLKKLINESGFRVLKIYKTGGFLRAFFHLLELFFKHFLSKKISPPKRIKRLIEKEYNSGKGFYEIHILAETV